MGFRFSGEQHYKIIEKITGVNLMERILEFAVGRDISGYKITAFDDGYMPKPSCNLPVLLGNGTIAAVNGMDILDEMKEIVSYCINHEVGDTIIANGSYGQMLGRFNLVADSEENLQNAIKKVYQHLRTDSIDGDNMLLAIYEPIKSSFNNDFNKKRQSEHRLCLF